MMNIWILITLFLYRVSHNFSFFCSKRRTNAAGGDSCTTIWLNILEPLFSLDGGKWLWWWAKTALDQKDVVMNWTEQIRRELLRMGKKVGNQIICLKKVENCVDKVWWRRITAHCAFRNVLNALLNAIADMCLVMYCKYNKLHDRQAERDLQ